MTGLIILSVILIFLAVIFFSPFRIYVDYQNGKSNVTVKYLFLWKKTGGKSKKKSSSDKKEKNNNEKTDKEKNKKNKIIPEDTKGKIEFFLGILKSGGKSLRHAAKRIKICRIVVDFVISDYDACDCAIKFGKANMAVYNTLSYLGCFFKMKKKSINIKCVYNQPECIYNASFIIKFTPASGIWALTVFIFTFLVNNKKSKEAQTVQTAVGKQ